MDDPQAKSRISQLASLISDMETRVSKQSHNRAESLSSVTNHVSEIEHALNMEITRRADLERRLSESSDLKIKAAMDRLADAVESEMTRLYRKMDAEVTARLDHFSKELASTHSQRMPAIERSLEVALESQKRLSDHVGRLDLRLKLLDERMDEGNKNSVLVDQIRVHARDDIVRLRSDISRDVTDLRSNLKESRALVSSLSARLDSELSTLQSELRAETASRREADKELIDVVTQYANVMNKQSN